MGQSAAVRITTEEALFSSAHEALVFAFNFSSQCYDRPVMNRMAAPAVGSGKGLVGLDGAAQAGMVRAEVQSLGPLAEAILIARTAPHSAPCQCRSACCSGRKPNREWVDAVSYLADYVRHTALKGCTSNGLMRREYVVRYFTPKEKRVALEDLAEKHDVARNTVSAHASKVAQLFAGHVEHKDGKKAQIPGLEPLASEAIDRRLREVGMVGLVA